MKDPRSSAVLLLLTPFVFGCGTSKPQMSGLSFEAAGRVVVARVPAPSFIGKEGESIVLTSGQHKIVIDRERILLDGAELAKIPAEAKNFSIEISEAGLLAIDQDYKNIAKKQLASP